MKLKIDFDNVTGKIKPMHGVGQPPFSGTDFSMVRYLKDVGVPFSRLHDVGGDYGGNRWVDVPNIFRDFSADPEIAESYDFAFTDLLITALVDNGVEPFFRLGVSIENDAVIKAYRIYPPADYHKWAVICEHIIRHYTEGWAEGFHYNIRYWEIWNEPDNYEEVNENQMWRGNKEQFYELYAVASKHLKACFPHLKIGGYGSCGFYAIQNSFVESAKSSPRFKYFIEFFDGFLEYIKKENAVLDFFSWHSYDGIKNNIRYAQYARKRLDESGFQHTETICNEWNCGSSLYRGSAKHAAIIAAMMLAFQNTPLDCAMFYDARLGVSEYGSLFNPLTHEPFPAYYAFGAYNGLYMQGQQVMTETEGDDIYALAAKGDRFGCAVIANISDSPSELNIVANKKITRCVCISKSGNEEEIFLPDAIQKDCILTLWFEM